MLTKAPYFSMRLTTPGYTRPTTTCSNASSRAFFPSTADFLRVMPIFPVRWSDDETFAVTMFPGGNVLATSCTNPSDKLEISALATKDRPICTKQPLSGTVLRMYPLTMFPSLKSADDVTSVMTSPSVTTPNNGTSGTPSTLDGLKERSTNTRFGPSSCSSSSSSKSSLPFLSTPSTKHFKRVPSGNFTPRANEMEVKLLRSLKVRPVSMGATLPNKW
mmetsp:Transcript_4411/g.6841  ORF Transcript_4411/g.6841 Transcript_4411/m.6841 type:complete len:218 (-) Transcript_4411:142-795(-)